MPISKVAAVYPDGVASRGLEGYVIVEFTVTREGTVRDVSVVESTSSLFERSAVEAALQYRYSPRVIDGEAVDVSGVRHKIDYRLRSCSGGFETNNTWCPDMVPG